jgi:transposase-like protein
MEAYLHDVSTRKVDDPVKALGADTGISKSEVGRVCADLDAEVGAFQDRSLAELQLPYVFLDATYCKARVERRVVSRAVVIATGSALMAGARGPQSSPSATPRTARSGPRSCAASRQAAWAGCS